VSAVCSEQTTSPTACTEYSFLVHRNFTHKLVQLAECTTLIFDLSTGMCCWYFERGLHLWVVMAVDAVLSEPVVEFLTVLVYTCSVNCWTQDTKFVEEFALVEYDRDSRRVDEAWSNTAANRSWALPCNMILIYCEAVSTFVLIQFKLERICTLWRCRSRPWCLPSRPFPSVAVLSSYLERRARGDDVSSVALADVAPSASLVMGLRKILPRPHHLVRPI